MTNWFANLETKAQMNSLAIGAIEEIMGDISTTAPSKLIGIARWLRELDLARNAKMAPRQRDLKEITQGNCSIDSSRIESLVDFPLVKRGPDCEKCQCFNCDRLTRCHILLPSTLKHCAYACGGHAPITNCEYANKENEICE